MTEPISSLEERPSRRFAWLALATVMLPVAYLTLLILGGGSGGFKAWNDLVFLLGLIILSALAGIAFAAVSIRRDEQSVVAYFALLLHITMIFLAVWALLQ